MLPDNDPSYPPGGVAVTVFDADGNTVPGVVTSTAAGVSWTADVIGLVGSDFRVEFDISAADQAAGFSDTFLGPDSSSSVTFASAGDSNISFVSCLRRYVPVAARATCGAHVSSTVNAARAAPAT